jgi:hypothetical protein
MEKTLSSEIKTALSRVGSMLLIPLVGLGIGYILIIRPEIAHLAQERKIDRLQQGVSKFQKDFLSYAIGGQEHEDMEIEIDSYEIPRAISELKDAGLTKEARENLEIFIRSYDRWSKQLVQPVVEKRKQVNAGKATLAELQTVYLSCNPEQKNADLEMSLSNIRFIQFH